MKRYLVVLNAKKGVSILEVQSVLSEVAWYRIASNCWIVQSPATADTVTEALRQFVEPGGTVFVTAIDRFNHQGLMPNDFWEWFNPLAG